MANCVVGCNYTCMIHLLLRTNSIRAKTKHSSEGKVNKMIPMRIELEIPLDEKVY